MDFDFTKLLLLFVVITGVLWAIETFIMKKKRAADTPRPGHVEWGADFFPVLAFVFFLRAFLFEPFQIPSGSMIPTLEVGDFIVVSKFSYGVRLPVVGTKIIPVGDPKRGDVAVFVPPHDDSYFIKRVVGLPGDRIKVENNIVYINDEAYEQTFIAHTGVYQGRYRDAKVALSEEKIGDVVHQINTFEPPGEHANMAEIVVPDGHYFMMGDNRDNSGDSRAFGTVPNAKLVGRAKVIWMHWKDWKLPSFSRVGAIQ